MMDSRKKSCNQCRLSKKRCGLEAPKCLRCIERGLDCRYAHQTKSLSRSSKPGGTFHSWLADSRPAGTDAASGSPTLIESRGSASADFSMAADLDLNELLNEAGEMDWDGVDAVLSAGGDQSSKVDDLELEVEERHPQNEQYWWNPSIPSMVSPERDILNFSQLYPVPTKNHDQLPADLSMAMKQSSMLVNNSWKTLKNSEFNIPTILQRKTGGTVEFLTAGNFLWATIAAYGKEFGNGGLPPFIHPNCITSYTNDHRSGEDLPEALANCRSIVPMYQNKTPTSRPLARRTLMSEVQRLYEDFRSYDELGQLHALQALTLYIILVAADDEPCNLARLIVRIAMGEIAGVVQQKGFSCPNEGRIKCPSWQDWVQEESRRRTLTILHLMDLILDFNIGQTPRSACFQFDKIPLPCCKTAWNAKTKAEWEIVYFKYVSKRKSHGVLKIGDWRRSKQEDISTLDNDMVADLSNWSTDLDNFGSMILIGGMAGL